MKRPYIIIVTLLLQYSYIIAQEGTSPSNTYHLVTESKYVDDGVYLIGEYLSSNKLYIMRTDNLTDGKMKNPITITDYTSQPHTITLPDDTENYPLKYIEFEIKKVTGGYSIRQDNKYLCTTTTPTLSLESTYSTNGVWAITDFSTDYYRLKFAVGKTYLNFHKDNSYFYVSGSKNIGPVLYRKDHTVTIGATHFATYYNGTWDSKVPEGVIAYTFTIIDKGQNIELSKTHEYKSGDIIPAGCPVLLFTNGESKYVMELSLPDTSLPKYGNALVGTDCDSSVSPSDNYIYYILSLDENKDINSIGFYPIDNLKNSAHKAYLPVSKTSGSKPMYFSLDFIDDYTSEVCAPSCGQTDDDKTYNITGGYCNPNHHGIIIRNGKKYIK